MSEESSKLRLQPRLTLETPPPPEPVAADSPTDLSGLDFPALPLPLEAPAFPDPEPPPIETTEVVEEAPPLAEETPTLGEPPPKLRMALRPRSVEPTAALAPLPAAISPSAVAGPAHSSPATPEMVAAGRQVQRAALGIGVAGALMFAVAGYVAYQNLGGDANAHTEATPAEPRKPWSFRRQRTDTEQTLPGHRGKSAKAEPAEDTPDAAPTETEQISQPAPTGPSAAFQAWVSNLKINGVRPGANPRILVARKLYAAGELINPELGITFESYDSARHTVRFRDRAGFFLEREDR